MTDDHRALIKRTRQEHQPFTTENRMLTLCQIELEDWPCLTASLATALEGAERAVSIAQQASELWERNHNGVRDQRDAALARLAQAERSAASWQEEARAAYLRRDELRGHYDAVREQVIVVTQRLAAARTALGQFANPEHWLERADGRLVWIGPHPPDRLARAALATSPGEQGFAMSAPCASCGQDPAVGHNLGCPDGARLGGEAERGLTDLEQRVLWLRFNARGTEAMSLHAVAALLGVSFREVKAAQTSGERKFPEYDDFLNWLRLSSA